MVVIPSQFRFVTASQVKAGNFILKCYPQMTHGKLKFLSRKIRNGKNNRHIVCVADSGTILNFEMEIKMSFKEKTAFYLDYHVKID